MKLLLSYALDKKKFNLVLVSDIFQCFFAKAKVRQGFYTIIAYPPSIIV